MSICEHIEFQCPSCNSSQTIEIWRSINTQENPELKKELFEGRINVFHCLECDFEGSLPVDLLYHDVENQFCVQFFPFEWILDDKFIQRFRFQDGNVVFAPQKDILSLPAYLRNFQITFNMNEMIRYIIFLEKVLPIGKNW